MDINNIEQISESILKLLPQQDPFRYLDRLVEVDDAHIVGQYTYKKNEWFYKGHFPGNPLTPGVILIETMAQTAVVAFGIYLVLKEGKEDPRTLVTVFTDVEAEFHKNVLPGETVTVKAEKLFFRKKKLKCKVELFLKNGQLAATATLAGMGVPT